MISGTDIGAVFRAQCTGLDRFKPTMFEDFRRIGRGDTRFQKCGSKLTE
jgi:hypothetical protein